MPDLTQVEPGADLPGADMGLSVQVGCDSCGARASYADARDTRAFFTVHPYLCDRPDDPAACD